MKPWTKDELLFLKNNACKGAQFCCESLGRNWNSVKHFRRRKLRRLKFRRFFREVEAEARLWYDRGLSDGEIGAKVGFNRDSVRRWRDRYHLPPICKSGTAEWRARCVRPENIEIIDLISRGLSIKEIAPIVGISELNIRLRLFRWGIDKKERQRLAAEQAGAQLDYLSETAGKRRKAC